MKDYDAYLFDWDGTLSQTLTVWVAVIQKAYESYGISLTTREIGPLLGDWPATLAFAPTADRQELKRTIEAEAGASMAHTPLYDGVTNLLQHLKQHHKKLALISTTKRQTLNEVLQIHDLKQYFNLVIAGDEVRAHKPDPEGILVALQRLGVQKHQAVMIGDSDKDLGAAKNAGIDSMLFYPDTHNEIHDRDHLQSFNPAHIITSWNELMKGVQA